MGAFRFILLASMVLFTLGICAAETRGKQFGYITADGVSGILYLVSFLI